MDDNFNYDCDIDALLNEKREQVLEGGYGINLIEVFRINFIGF
jgi:hypothetical protein